MIQLSAMNINNTMVAKIDNGTPNYGMLEASRNRIVATSASTIQKIMTTATFSSVSICTALLRPNS